MSNDVATIVINGLVNGCIYALIGVGFVVIFRATGVVSFAQGASRRVAPSSSAGSSTGLPSPG